MTLRHHRRLPFGAELIAPDRTRFRLWAPSCERVSLAIEGRDEIAMLTAGEGWFEVDADCGAGTHYRYRVVPQADGDDGAGALLVPDPASRAQVDDVHGPSIVIDPESYRWTHDDWRGRAWCETVIYEIHVGLAGGFRGVQHLLPQLADLGVTAIELMPLAEFSGARNWGYDGALPFAPDTAYGTPDELKALVDAAHGHGLMVFLDVVYNHFGPEGNYIGTYADAFFRDDIKTPWGRAIDFRIAEVRDFFRNNALFWLMEYRLDGLRLDATHSIVPQDWLKDLSMFVLDMVDVSRHVHLVIEHEGNAAHLLGPTPINTRGYDAQWNDDGHHVLHVLLTGETDGYYVDFAEAPEDKLARCLAEGFVYQGQPSIFREGVPRGEPSKDLPPTAFVLFLQNHDQIGNRAFGQRLTTLADPAALWAASALVLLSPQIPLLFMGEEWGATEPFLYFTSYPDEELAAAVRDGRRNEFANARGFSDPASRYRIPDPNAPATFE
ncbi:MAG: malto-oligosyltrehalose trehalohydrolase, partial [Burkholderiaceae bacterium]